MRMRQALAVRALLARRRRVLGETIVEGVWGW
jgi:hypothetical protein